MKLAKKLFSSAALVLLLGAPGAAAADPFPADFCAMQTGEAPAGMSLVVAYGIMLGERYQADQLDQETFQASLVSLQSVNRLIVEGEGDAACLLLGGLEDAYALPRPDLSEPAPYQMQVRADQ